jgi:hypothetical protein
MDFSGQNVNPRVFDTSANRRALLPLDDEDDGISDELDSQEVRDRLFAKMMSLPLTQRHMSPWKWTNQAKQKDQFA